MLLAIIRKKKWVLCINTLSSPDPFQSWDKTTKLSGLYFDLWQSLKVLVCFKRYIRDHVLYNSNRWSLISHFFTRRRQRCFLACAKQSRCSEDLLGLPVITEMAYFAVLCFCETEGVSLIRSLTYRILQRMCAGTLFFYLCVSQRVSLGRGTKSERLLLATDWRKGDDERNQWRLGGICCCSLHLLGGICVKEEVYHKWYDIPSI